MQVVAPRCQQLPAPREIDAVHAALVCLQSVLEAQSPHDGGESVALLLEPGEPLERIVTQLPGAQVREVAGDRRAAYRGLVPTSHRVTVHNCVGMTG